MDELLQQLLESNLLSEETKKLVSEQFAAHIKKIEDETRNTVTTEVRAELANQFVADKEKLIEALDTKVTEALQSELAELKEDIERFRDLEAEMAEKLVEARKEMANTLKKDMAELVETLDAFCEMRLTEEFTELNESIAEVKRLEFGRRIFEAFAPEFEKYFADKDGTQAALAEAKTKLDETQKVLDESKKELETVKRNQKMTEVLEPLHGRPREVMEAILKSVPTEKLAEAYETFISRVLHEATTKEDKPEKDSVKPVLAENTTSTAEVEADKTVVVTGDNKTALEESAKDVIEDKPKANPNVERLKRLAGLE